MTPESVKHLANYGQPWKAILDGHKSEICDKDGEWIAVNLSEPTAVNIVDMANLFPYLFDLWVKTLRMIEARQQ